MRQTRDSSAELGHILVLLNRFNTHRLPYARQLQAKVDRGELLSDYDMRFLKKVFEECAHARRLAEKHPRYQSVVSRATSMYGDIMRKALDNEHAATQRKPTLPQ
jgi:hypothetical protein